MKLNLIVLMVLAGLQWSIAQATGKHHNITINNYYETPQPPGETSTETVTITSGISDDELAEGLAGAAAAGAHQFDYSTSDWQGSITGAFIDSEDGVSFGVGKRFKKLDALFHGSYTRVLDNDHLYVIGGTFRF